MCLEVTIKLSQHAKTGVGAERLAAASGLTVVKGQSNLGSCLHLSSGGPCSCDLLAKGQPQDKDHWVLSEAAAESLSRAVRFVSKEAKSFTFQARWLGEQIHEPRRMKTTALAEAVSSNRVPKNLPVLVGTH